MSLLTSGMAATTMTARPGRRREGPPSYPPEPRAPLSSFENQLVGKGGGADDDGDKALLFESLCRDVEREGQQCHAQSVEWRDSLKK